jgi:NitT/TauT family transport system ATP-binding protein
MSAPHASLRGIERRYGGAQPIHALGPIDLDLAPGEFFSIVGPSGCGKSTLLDVLSGLGRPTAGTVTFEGKPVEGAVPAGVGVVFQEDSSFAWLTVRNNVALAFLPKKSRAGSTMPLGSWGCRSSPATILRNYPAACDSAFALLGRWCSSPG